ncbi:MAG: hypothetical protein IK094_10525, partial [Treponema sp.]|nr:hypothetical protein [Treponema sp.]
MGAKKIKKLKASFAARAPLLAFAALIFACVLFSCGRKKEKVLEEYTPLSKSAEELSVNAQWAYEIEGDRLSKKIDSFEAVSKMLPLSPLTMAALEGGLPMRGVYPDLNGFENLDTSGLQGELLETVKSFCKAFVEFSSSVPAEGEEKNSAELDALFSSKTLFSLSLFIADSQEAGPFESFVVGRPFVGEDLIEVPVRFSGKKEYLFC